MNKEIRLTEAEKKEEKNKKLKFYRIIMLIVPYFYFVFGLFFYNSANIDDPISLMQRGIIILIFLTVFLLSFFNEWIKTKIEELSYILIYAGIMHLAYISYLNSFSYNLAATLIAVLVIANLFFAGKKILLYCNLFLAVFIGITLTMAQELSPQYRLLYYFVYLSTAVFTYLISYHKQKAKDEIDIINNKQRKLLNNIDIQIWYLTDIDQYGEVNQAHADFIGAKKEEVENKKISNFFSETEANNFIENNKRVFAEKKKVKQERWVRNHRGEERLLSISRIPKLNAKGEVEFLVCSAEDITVERQKDQKLKNIFQNFGIAYWSVDIKNEKLIEASPSTEKLYGYPLEDWYNNSNFWFKIIHPEDKIKVETSKESYKEKSIAEEEYRVYKQNGEVIWTKNYIIPIKNNKNELIRVDGLSYDITERKKQEKALEQSEKRYRTIFESAPIAIIIEDQKGNILEVNEAICELTDYTKEELESSNIFDKFVLEENREIAQNNIQKILNGEDLEFDIKTPTKNGDFLYTHLKETSIILPDGEKGILSMQVDITERKMQEEKIEYLSYRDILTGLYNRRFLEEEMKRLDTERQLPISIIMADVNGLKLINDSFGHKEGDQLLIETAQLLNTFIREEDILARYGGDEFLILLPQTSKEAAEKVLKRIKAAFKAAENEELPLSISLGAATKNAPQQSLNQVLKNADDRMYQNKLSESRSSKSNVIENILNTLGTKTKESKEHALRMEKLALQLGEELNLSNSELNRLALLAKIHDIGKVTIPEEILVKTDKLSGKEWKIMREHPEKGYRIASASQEFSGVAEEILAHHERWDGNGYPRGLSEAEIPYLARIITIIDAYDVMTNERPYSSAISQAEALNEIQSCSGTQFDPEIAAIFTNLMR